MAAAHAQMSKQEHKRTGEWKGSEYGENVFRRKTDIALCRGGLEHSDSAVRPSMLFSCINFIPSSSENQAFIPEFRWGRRQALGINA